MESPLFHSNAVYRLKAINESIRQGTVFTGIRNLTKAGVGTMVFVVNHPGQSRRAYENTVKFTGDHHEYIGEVALTRFHPARSTLPFIHPENL